MEASSSFPNMQIPSGGEIWVVPQGEVKKFLSVVEGLHIKAERTALKAITQPGNLVGVKLGDRQFFEYFTKDDFEKIQKAFKKAHGHAGCVKPPPPETLGSRIQAAAARAGESISHAFSEAYKSLKNFFEEIVSVCTANTSKHAELVFKMIAKPEQAANFKKLGEIFKIAQDETDEANKLIKSGNASYQKVLWEKAHDAEQKFLNNASQIAAEAMEHHTDLLLTPEDRKQLNDLIGQYKTLRQSLVNRMKLSKSPVEIMEMKYKLVVVDDRIDQAAHFEERNNAYIRILQASTLQELRQAASFLPNSKQAFNTSIAMALKDAPEQSVRLIDLKSELAEVHNAIQIFEAKMDLPDREEKLKETDLAAIVELKKMEREILKESQAILKPAAKLLINEAIVQHRTDQPHIKECVRLMLSQDLAANKVIESSKDVSSRITKEQLHLEMREKVYFGVAELLEGKARKDFEAEKEQFNQVYTTNLEPLQLELLKKPKALEKHSQFKVLLQGALGVSHGFRLVESRKEEPIDFEATAKKRSEKLLEVLLSSDNAKEISKTEAHKVDPKLVDLSSKLMSLETDVEHTEFIKNTEDSAPRTNWIAKCRQQYQELLKWIDENNIEVIPGGNTQSKLTAIDNALKQLEKRT